MKIRLAAKTDVGLARSNNEDNFQVASDLSVAPMRWVNDAICPLGDKGALLVVADGMGGMNAGEVASELAIKSLSDSFAPEHLTEEVMRTRFTIEKFMNRAIIEADARIKQDAKNNPESRGMGTTIVVAWLLGNKLYVSWCGDSRAYVYNPKCGLHQITKDHSYVQKLVDRGSISRYDAFDYPESNIITRCLGDGSTKAKPESLLHPYELCDGDIILLCTDGLSGMIRDEEIEAVIRANEDSMDDLSSQLIQAACNAAGSDNITLCLCQVIEGGATPNINVFEEYERRLNGPAIQQKNEVDGWNLDDSVSHVKKRKRNYFIAFVITFFFVVSFSGGFFVGHSVYPFPCKIDVTPKDSVVSPDTVHPATKKEPTRASSSKLATGGHSYDSKLDTNYYKIKINDTYESIADNLKVNVDSLKLWNQSKDLIPGDSLIIKNQE